MPGRGWYDVTEKGKGGMGGGVGWWARPYKKKIKDLTTTRVVVRRCDTIYLSAMVDSGKIWKGCDTTVVLNVVLGPRDPGG